MSNLTILAMELNDLKSIWLKEKKELENKIALNLKLVESILSKSKNSLNKSIKTAILGRNLALIYMAISLILASKVFYEFEYSIPAYIGAIAMLFSFFQHISLKKPDFSKMSTVELQKAISQFRIHTLKYSKYDISIVILWFLTVMPICLKHIIFSILKIHISLLSIYAITLLFILSSLIRSRHIYKRWNEELKESEEQLNLIIEFEKN